MFNKVVILFLTVIFQVSCGLMKDVSINETPIVVGSENNANLSGLTFSSGTLSPSFNQDITSYSSQVDNNTNSITVTPVTASNFATVKVNNISVVAGMPSASISLNIGINNITCTVKAQDGTTKTYLISVERLSRAANLSDLTVSSGNLCPTFAENTTSYIVYAYNATSTTVTPTVAEAGAMVTVNGITVISGAASQSFSLGTDSAAILIRVTSSDGTLVKNYNIKIYIMASPVLVGHWPLASDYINKQNNVSGYWMGTWMGGTPDLSGPEYVTESGRMGLHFQYTANGLYYNYTNGYYCDAAGNQITGNESGNWVDCEKNEIQSELNIGDYLTVSFWFFWDADLMRNYLGTQIQEENVEPVAGLDIIMNIMSKSVFWNNGWQIRFEQSSVGSIVYLYLHNNGAYAKLPIVDNFSDHRNKWVHLTVTIDNINNEVFTYVNGVATNASPQTYEISFLPVPDPPPADLEYTGHFAIGAFSHPWGGFTVNGKISDVQFYHGVIDSNQALYLYNHSSL